MTYKILIDPCIVWCILVDYFVRKKAKKECLLKGHKSLSEKVYLSYLYQKCVLFSMRYSRICDFGKVLPVNLDVQQQQKTI